MSNFKNELTQLRALAERLTGGGDRDYAVNDVLSRIDSAYAATRDAGLHTLRNAVAAHGDGLLIRQSDLRAMWDRVASMGRSEVVREHLGDLLGDEGPANPVRRTQMLGPGGDLDISVDSAGRYAGLWGSPGMQKFADAGLRSISAELSDYGIQPELRFAAQDDRFVVYAARVEDGGRESTFLIPAEVRSGAVLLPSVFYGNGFAEFNQSNINRWIAGGHKTASTGVALIDHLNNLAGPAVPSVDAGDWKVTPDSGSVVDLGSALSPVLANAEVPESLDDKARQMGGAEFERIFVEATLKCGLTAVAAAKRVVSVGLSQAGVRHGDVSVEKEIDGGLLLGTHIRSAGGTRYISVPVELNGQSALMPSIFQGGNGVHTWDECALKSFAAGDGVDFHASASNLSGRTFGELYRIAIANSNNGNLAGAEEALAVILAQYGDDHHRQTLQDMTSLITKSATASRSELNSYADKLQSSADDVAGYINTRADLRDFGLLD